MPVRSCRVTIQDMDGVSHTVEVTAATLYEAVAQGLAAIRGNEWVAGIAQGLNVVKVSVADVRVEHEVRLMDFTKWLERTGGSPREVSDRHKIRAIWGCRCRGDGHNIDANPWRHHSMRRSIRICTTLNRFRDCVVELFGQSLQAKNCSVGSAKARQGARLTSVSLLDLATAWVFHCQASSTTLLTILIRIRPASGLIQSRVALCSTASAQLDAAPSHH
jgi:hypothetical protein